MPVLSGSSRGFTLGESLFVLLILSLTLAAAYPNLRHWQVRLQEKAEARALLAAFQQARAEAARRNCSVLLDFREADTLQGGGYRILAQEADGSLRELQALTPFSALRLERARFGTSSRGGFNQRGLPSNGSGSVDLRSRCGQASYRLTLSLYGSVRLEV
ncbi:GspH/FimT family pseudopilin [Geoalkalibacter sp.]|uniref:GspH/FimT family pseudopilin n=1 Tax=Geoalkalibacter sp. TaxID=3041440 RepID=UPI00272E1E5F|nr:GspH/FimT family pseudopilin [Geoalkalibacter sp.]